MLSKWNWEHTEWPTFTYDSAVVASMERQFIQESGVFIGSSAHLSAQDTTWLKVQLLTDEAIQTSAIEGDILDRASVQSSIQRFLGLSLTPTSIRPHEDGIAEMMLDAFSTFRDPLEHTSLYQWHRMVARGRSDLEDIGHYRTSASPMQVVSGAITRPNIHFEAPPSDRVPKEMDRFITWFNSSSQSSPSEMVMPLTRAAIAHLYFVSIHPFEDGNGRIARALAEKAISQTLGQPLLLALSDAIFSDRQAYYSALDHHNKELDITGWIHYFAQVALVAQTRTRDLIHFLIRKSRFLDRVSPLVNHRQLKVIRRVLDEGPEGFDGGLSARNYISIAKTSRATATRDLQDLVERGILCQTGHLKHRRYFVKF